MAKAPPFAKKSAAKAAPMKAKAGKAAAKPMPFGGKAGVGGKGMVAPPARKAK